MALNKSWREQSACLGADPEWWFPHNSEGTKKSSGHTANTRKAKKICMECPVRIDCLEYAMSTGQYWGIWGGFDFDERTQLRKTKYAAQRNGRSFDLASYMPKSRVEALL